MRRLCSSLPARHALALSAVLFLASACLVTDDGANDSGGSADGSRDAGGGSDLGGAPDARFDSEADSGGRPDGGAADDVQGSDATVPDLGSDEGPDVRPTTCPGPTEPVPAEAMEAWDTASAIRLATGVPCAALIPAINTSAQNHCAYYVANSGACTENPHVEVEGCDGYTGANFWDRMAAAGYNGSPAFEDMHFVGDGAQAVQGWVDSVWHRSPVLSPWVRDQGYGQTAGCDTMDFGVGAATPSDAVATYPYDGQTGVPASFFGNEGPEPPAPPAGWPSGYIVHIWAQGATIAAHLLTVEGSDTPIDHVWLSPNDDAWYTSLIANEHILYANEPLASGTTYRVRISGTYTGGALDLDWTFTTQ